jgi:hypothetical protein
MKKNKKLPKNKNEKREKDLDEALTETFPASDPPNLSSSREREKESRIIQEGTKRGH